MLNSFINVFIDPQTKKPLGLRILKARDNEIISGEFYGRYNRYPIVSGIPRFITESQDNRYPASSLSPDLQTVNFFGRKWKERVNKEALLNKKSFQGYKEQLMATLGCQTYSQLKNVLNSGKRILNAGCGIAWPEIFFNFNEKNERHCIDVSSCVEVAHKVTKHFRNVVVSQASIYNLPYRDGFFDVVYCIGVIHHTRQPKEALIALAKKLAPGGILGAYIYSKKPLLRECADSEIRRLTTSMSYEECMRFSKKMTKLGKALSLIKEQLSIPEDINLLGIKKGKYKLHELVYDYFLKCWYNPLYSAAYADLVNQDWYHPFFASHHTKEEIKSWFKEAELLNLRFIQPRGWRHSGYFVSGIKR
jgi:SAM-dependent methyltransferase/uncharacterized protein YbaR (Trm112 family)